ncbi:LysM peptidoglycan-binding domain-containing protein [Metabacillus litoralis]|uniref:LysM peptidoglycan-binding domain-containing protein n=1 Tax=Metabacillus litoralis TaxID=152268 RepID=A0A5C6W0X9_9BACI|nr:cell wall hydrolase [Metabacillus litoralis]TXC91504.1 LysM peptidoglycan-binding domain-containing protein [Metabacillus litoralis]
MKKLIVKLVAVSTLALSLTAISTPQTKASAATTHQVQSGDTLWLIGKKHGISVNTLMSANRKSSHVLLVGEKLVIPQSITSNEMDLLARLVHAEAKGEPYAGKVAVATVVLNRVDSSLFPNTINGVIYQKDQGYYAFSPVKNGAINQPADNSAKAAVKEALAFRGMGKGSLYFYNPKTAKSTWITSREVTTVIGNHRFAK